MVNWSWQPLEHLTQRVQSNVDADPKAKKPHTSLTKQKRRMDVRTFK